MGYFRCIPDTENYWEGLDTSHMSDHWGDTPRNRILDRLLLAYPLL